jgi:AcrR family transcriptional regulator
MTTSDAPTGVIPPRQARSRAALERLLAAAREVLATQGFDEFTIAAVAERAGVSVGGVYRRFTGKEQLLEAVIDGALEDLQTTIAGALSARAPGIDGVVDAFTHGFAEYLARVGPLYTAVLSAPRPADRHESGLAAIAGVQRLFFDAALPHSAEITHPSPSTALTTAMRTVLAAGVHRAAVAPWWPDGLGWDQWADEITAMTTAYLTA